MRVQFASHYSFYLECSYKYLKIQSSLLENGIPNTFHLFCLVLLQLLASWFMCVLYYYGAVGDFAEEMAAESWYGNYDTGSQSDDSYRFERMHIEPIYDSFFCPLTKQVMRDPVTLENGQTFEREAIEKWFRECKESGRNLQCPLTLKELKSADLKPSIALRNTIEEWSARNEAAQLDMASKSLNLGSSESDILLALDYVQQICQKSRSNKRVARNAGLLPMIVDMLKSGSRKVRCKALETLQIVVEDDSDNKVAFIFFVFFSLKLIFWFSVHFLWQ